MSSDHIADLQHEIATRHRPRLSREELFMEVAKLYGLRSSCPRASVGAVAVRAGRIVATGYCGAPHGLPHCDEVGCHLVEGHCIRSVHAEANLVAWAARTGTGLDGTTVYCTHKPCHSCSKLLANAGIVELTYEIDYDNQDANHGVRLLRDLGVVVNGHV